MAKNNSKHETITPSNTQKMILLALSEGWRLRLAHHHGWCLFQAGRNRPFAQMRERTIEAMTHANWLTDGIARPELSFLPEKVLTAKGRRIAERLIAMRWAEDYEWEPYPLIAGSIGPDDSMSDSMAA
jgi:hypothetical protein